MAMTRTIILTVGLLSLLGWLPAVVWSGCGGLGTALEALRGPVTRILVMRGPGGGMMGERRG